MNTLYKQVELVQNNTTMITWLENDSRIKENIRLTLKNIPGIWLVNKVYTNLTEQSDIKSDWKVGGLH